MPREKMGQLSEEPEKNPEQSDLNFEKKPEAKEFAGEKVVASFQKFIEKHIVEFDPDGKKSPVALADYFYENFYQKDVDQVKYHDDDKTKKMIENYDSAVKSLIEGEEGDSAQVLSDPQKKWIYQDVNGGFNQKGKDIGRFYLNLRPEKTVELYKKTIEKCASDGLHIQTKIPAKGRLRSFNKLDKMVIYFNSGEEQDILKVLEELYRENENCFDDTGIPKFTAEIKSSDGKILNGIGFGEDPRNKEKTFGTLRSEMLAEIYMEIRDLKQKNPNKVYDFKDYYKIFKKYCRMSYYAIDSQNPAFNLSKKAGKLKKNKFFPLIRDMTK